MTAVAAMLHTLCHSGYEIVAPFFSFSSSSKAFQCLSSSEKEDEVMTTDSLSALDGITWKRQLKATCAPKPSLAFWAPRNNEEEEEEAGRKATQLGRNAATTDYDGGLR